MTLIQNNRNEGDQVYVPRLKLDPEKYRHHLDGMDITEEQANELLATLWQIMSTMVDIGWGVDTLNIILPELFEQKNLPANDNTQNHNT